LVASVRSSVLVETLHGLAAYYDENGKVSKEGAEVLIYAWENCWRNECFRLGCQRLEFEGFLGIPEVAWFWLDMAVRDDCAEEARRCNIWTTHGHVLIDPRRHIESKLLSLRKLWLKE
jgi:hypothetical protein